MFAGSIAHFSEIMSNLHGKGLNKIRYFFNNKSASEHVELDF